MDLSDPIRIHEAVEQLKTQVLPELEAMVTDWIDRMEAVAIRMEKTVLKLDGASVTLNLKKEQQNATHHVTDVGIIDSAGIIVQPCHGSIGVTRTDPT
jgi:hypothetical protein